MTNALRVYVAGVVVTGLDFLCHLTNHVGACWLSFRGPFKPLHDWAFSVCNPPKERTECGAMQLPCTGTPMRCNKPINHTGSCHSYSVEGFTYVWTDNLGRNP